MIDTDSISCLASRLVSEGITEGEVPVVERQLGRYPRGVLAVGARCACGNPLVVITRPMISDGDKRIPFPTTLYLTAPEVVRPVSRLEGDGQMVTLNERLKINMELAEQYRCAHESYLAFRHEIARITGDDESLIASRSAGGMPDRVKCLHALTAQSLVMGTGVNPIGDICLEMLRTGEAFDRNVCRCTYPAASGAASAAETEGW